MSRQRSIVVSLFLIAACGNRADVETAKHSLYDADFAIVYTAALEATHDLYPSTDDMPGAGAIKTAWHQVPLAANMDDMATSRAVSITGSPMQTQQSQGANGGAMPTRLVSKKFYVRFDVSVVGGRPWRVKVAGHASEWEPGAAMPSELRGIARPSWLDGRTDALVLAIYSRIKTHAVPMKELPPDQTPEEKLPQTDPTTFSAIPAPAAKRLAHLRDMASRRDYVGLREDLAPDVRFSLGADGDIEVAMVTWQADPEVLDAMTRAIGPGCAPDPTDARRVFCPNGATRPGSYQLVLELTGADWKVTSFLKSE